MYQIYNCFRYIEQNDIMNEQMTAINTVLIPDMGSVNKEIKILTEQRNKHRIYKPNRFGWYNHTLQQLVIWSAMARRTGHNWFYGTIFIKF